MIQLADLFIKKSPKEEGVVELTSNPSIPEAVPSYQGIVKSCLLNPSPQLFKITINIKENIPKSKVNKREEKKMRILVTT